MKRKVKNIFKLGGVGIIAALSSQVYASGYMLEMQSASVLADSGEAAVVEDAGTNWYNSAGLVRLPMQAVMGAIDVYAPVRFNGTVFAPSTLNVNPLTVPFASNYAASGSVRSRTHVTLPIMHFSMPLKSVMGNAMGAYSDRVALGLSVVPAWGFIEDYGDASILRYNLNRVYTRSIDIAPSLAFKITDCFSIGGGPDFHYFYASLKNHVRTQGLGLAPLAGVGTFGDSISRFSAERWSYGGHVGALFSYRDSTRIGVNYRSKIDQTLKGYSDFDLDLSGDIVFPQNGVFESRSFSLSGPLPAVTTVSAYQDITPCWAMMGTIAYSQWSSLHAYHARNIIQPAVAGFAAPGVPIYTGALIPRVDIVQRMRDTVDFGIGTHYKLNQQMMLRANFKYIPTPTRTQYRYVSFPDGDKYGVQIGARLWASKCIAFDALYGHVWIKKEKIHDVNPITGATATGTTKSHIDLFGGQLVWNL